MANMDIKRLFVCEEDFVGSKKTVFILDIDCFHLTMRKIAGRDPYPEEIKTALALMLSELQEAYGPIERYERQTRYRFCKRTGMSGCQTNYIEYEEEYGFPTRKLLLHISCDNKTAYINAFLYDLLDLYVTSGYFAISDDGKTYVIPEEAKVIGGTSIQVVKPRHTCFEQGWTDPYDIPEEIVKLEVVREIPQDLILDTESDTSEE